MSRLFGWYVQEGKDNTGKEVTELNTKVDVNKEVMLYLQEKAREAETALYDVALAMPNFPDDTVEKGVEENHNVELCKVTEPRVFLLNLKNTGL